MEKKIAIALSGGIDSLVSAFLLKKKTPNLFGIHFITGFEKSVPTDPEHNSLSSIADQLQIPINTVDLRTEFKQQVVDYFVKTYQMGRTPNPCMVCNASIKFGTLLHHARRLGADRLATGHYAKKIIDDNGKFHLLRGADAAKDQSYFLSFLNQEQLAYACFPLGKSNKSDVVALAKENNLIPVVKDESQDICFIPKASYTDFLSRQPGFTSRPGPIVDTMGHRLGEHKGLHYFTVGQRKGINIPASEPYYVTRIIPEENKLVVGFKPDLYLTECYVSDINWISDPVVSDITVLVQVRYRHNAVPGTLSPTEENRAKIIFNNPQSAITPGQGAVFYIKNEVIGGGWIDGGR